jgi:hypothetical protein
MTRDLMPIYADDYEFRGTAEGDIVRIGVNQLSAPVLVALGFFALAAFSTAAARWLAGSLSLGGAAVVVVLAGLICGLPVAHTLRLRAAGTVRLDAANALLRIEQQAIRREISSDRVLKVIADYRRLRRRRGAIGELGRFSLLVELTNGEAIRIATWSGPKAWKEEQARTCASLVAETMRAPLELPAACPVTELRRDRG